MGALFPRWTNSFSRAAGAVVLATPAAAIAGLMLYVRSPLNTGERNPVGQPVQFDHRHHTADEGIDCRYCHSTAETSPHAGLPSTATCMGCHAQLWNKSPKLEPVRAAYFSGQAIRWNRVHDLPDHVYFNHSIHLAKGVGCAVCHGRVDQMAQVQQAVSNQMAFCLECHRNPAPYLRPPEKVAEMDWQPNRDPEELGRELMQKLDVRARTSCTACHR
ncbi:MAG: cytochrome c3 family protein [Myxococcales bacterium]|nr:cytochrome c3 family protein [Myxococcales bacterium]